jgi:branched-chain amino acid transport system ATP-binding protein
VTRTTSNQEVSESTAQRILHTVQLSAGYGSVPVVHDVEISVHEGEVVALLGANGAGKSTTLLTISGDLAPISGEVWIDGVVSTSPMHRRCRAGLSFVPEERAIFPSLSTSDNLRLGRGGVSGALEVMPELSGLLDRKAGLLSGGEQQILILARAIAARPRLLIADELSLGLAPMVVDRLLSAARQVADRGVGVLFVEQYARRALAVADRVYVMRRGRIVMSCTSAEARERLSEIEGLYLSAPEQ